MRSQQAHAPCTARAHPCPRAQVRQQRPSLACSQRVARVDALGIGGENTALGDLCRYVLGAVDGDIRAPVEQRFLDLLYEEALAADLRQRAILDSITRRAQDDEFSLATDFLLDPGRYGPGLGQRQIASARGDAKRLQESNSSSSSGSSSAS